MSRIKHPKEKKRLSLDRDHRILITDSNSRERAGVIRKIKKLGKHSIRRKESAILRTGLGNPAAIDEEIATKVPIKARGIRKESVVTLGQYLNPEIRRTKYNSRSISPLRKRNRR